MTSPAGPRAGSTRPAPTGSRSSRTRRRRPVLRAIGPDGIPRRARTARDRRLRPGRGRRIAGAAAPDPARDVRGHDRRTGRGDRSACSWSTTRTSRSRLCGLMRHRCRPCWTPAGPAALGGVARGGGHDRVGHARVGRPRGGRLRPLRDSRAWPAEPVGQPRRAVPVAGGRGRRHVVSDARSRRPARAGRGRLRRPWRPTRPAGRSPLRALAQTAVTTEQLATLRELAGDDVDLRWRMLTRLAEIDAVDPAEVEQLLHDRSRPGLLGAGAGCRLGPTRPSEEGGHLEGDRRRAQGADGVAARHPAGVLATVTAEILAPYADRYLRGPADACTSAA